MPNFQGAVQVTQPCFTANSRSIGGIRKVGNPKNGWFVVDFLVGNPIWLGTQLAYVDSLSIGQYWWLNHLVYIKMPNHSTK